MVFSVDCKAPVFIARDAGRPTLIQLVFALDDLALGGCHVRRKSEQEAACDPLLHRDTRTRIGIIAAQRRIDGQAG